MFQESDNPLLSPHFVKSRRRENVHQYLVPPSTSPPDFSNCSTDELIKERNCEIEKELRNHDIQLFYPLATAFDQDKEINKPLGVEINGPKIISCRDEIKNRIDKITDATVKKITKFPKPSLQKVEFNYWGFQSFLRQQQISHEAHRLAKIVIKRKVNPVSTPTENWDALLGEFEKLYGPVNENDQIVKMLLLTFQRSLQESADKFNEMLEMTWDTARVFGTDVALQLIKSWMQAELDNLKRPPEHSKNVKNVIGLYNVNPVTDPVHSEWFLLPRFCGPAGPSNLFIKHPGLEKKLIEYAAPPGVAHVEGYWPSLLDLTFTHPVRWCNDPVESIQEVKVEDEHFEHNEKYDAHQCLGKMIEHQNKTKGQSERDKLNRAGVYNGIHNFMREQIKKFPMGIAMKVFFEKFMAQRYTTKTLFPGFTYKQIVDKLDDVVFTSQLPPDSDYEDLILFPVFMKWILPEGDMPALAIFKRVWNKIVFTVKTSGGKIRCQDMHPLYYKYWSLKIQPVIYAWGFPKIEDFIKWCMNQKNWNGNGEGLIIMSSSGSATFDSDPFLIYKQAEN